MAEYRSKSYTYNTDKNMQIEPYYGPSSTTTRPPNGFTFHSASYSTASSNYYATAAPPPPPQPRNLKRSGGGSSSKSWSFNDPEFQRKRRVASYKVYSVEGKVKGMEKNSSSCKSGKKKTSQASKPPQSRYTWSKEEEDVLIACLKEMKAKGWKADNGFRTGYNLTLLNMIREHFPDTTLQANPHIKSKLTVWKKEYSRLFTLFKTSGAASFGEGNMLKIDNKNVWDGYKRVHPEITKCLNKPYPYYDDWVDVFGVDRATGEGAEDVNAVIQDLLDNPGPNKPNGENVVDLDDSSSDDVGMDGVEDDENEEPVTKPESDSKGKKPVKSKKRRSLDSSESSKAMVKVLETYVNKARDSFEKIASALSNHEPVDVDPAVAQREMIYNQLEEMIEFDEDQKIILSHKLIHDPMEGELFLKLKESSKPRFLRMLLKGKML